MSEQNEHIESLLKNAPKSPGVYLFKDKKDVILYIGKAKVLRNRVRSYFRGNPDSRDPKTQTMVNQIRDIEFIVTDSEVESLLLEANLVKEHRPRYNVRLKDDKSYPYVRITNEPYPRVFITRDVIKDGSKYYGPYTDVTSLRSTMRVVKKVFPIRSCRYHIDQESINQNKVSVCLDYHIKKCEGPCEGLVSKEHYNAMIDKVIDFLNGRTDDVIDYLTERMNEAADEFEYEEASRIRDQINAVKSYAKKQRVETGDFEDRDVLAMATEEDECAVVVLRLRSGKLIGREHFYLSGVENSSESSILEGFVKQYYMKVDFVPREILFPVLPENQEPLEEWLSSRSDRRVYFKEPKIGDKRKLQGLAEKNAKLLLGDLQLQKKKKAEYIPKTVSTLQEELQMEAPPHRIEAFDISHIGGTNTVASMVSFIDGQPRKGEYRRFKIKTVEGNDDFASIREVIQRRYLRVLEEKLPAPDLILIDGGKGQLNVAVEQLNALDFPPVTVIGLAKRLEEVYIPQQPDPIFIAKSSPGLILLQRIRDEAHRFAVAYHRKLRGKSMVVSDLDNIEGVGKIRKERLMKQFRSVKKLKKATIQEIAEVKGISESLAVKIKQQLTGEEIVHQD